MDGHFFWLWMVPVGALVAFSWSYVMWLVFIEPVDHEKITPVIAPEAKLRKTKGDKSKRGRR